MNRPTKNELHELYIEQRQSPETIGRMFNVTGRTVRNWMRKYNIQRLGPTHLRKGVPNTPNSTRKRTPREIRHLHTIALGQTPWNKGCGDITFLCEICGQEVTDKPYRRLRTCSTECKNKLSHIYRGENHWNYKGDKAGSVQRRRNWAQYKEWRASVLKNANYTCVCRNRRGGRLTAHHLYSWNDHPEKRFDPHNGACLCWKCHKSFHNDCSHHHTTKEMFEKWLVTRLRD